MFKFIYDCKVWSKSLLSKINEVKLFETTVLILSHGKLVAYDVALYQLCLNLVKSCQGELNPKRVNRI